MRKMLATIACLGLVVTACGDDDDTAGDGSSSSTTTGDDQTCTNEEGGFEVSYPQDWSTNDGEVLPSCSLFDPDGDDLDVPEGTEVPLDVAVSMGPAGRDFAVVAGAARGEEVASRDESEVDGRRAERLEVVAGPDAGLLPEGTRQTRWVVELADGALVARTNDVGEPSYDEKQAVLDAMVASLEVLAPDGGA